MSKILTIFVLLFSQAGFAASCDHLLKELDQMKEAQKVLLQTFVNKNESVAKGFDSQATHFSEKYQVDAPVEDSDYMGLRKAAEGFRMHQKREQQLVDRFQAKSDQVLSQVKECLKAQAPFSSAKQASR